MRFLFPLAAMLLLAKAPAPSTPEQAMLADLQALDARVGTIGHRLAVAGAPFCAERVRRPGFLIHGLVQYRPDLRPDAKLFFGLDDQPAVLATISGQPLRAGDRIVALNGEPVAPLPNAKTAAYPPLRAVEDRIDRALAQGPVTFGIERDGVRTTAIVEGEPGCASRFQIDPSNRLNASADGLYVKLSSRVAEFARNDDELALVIAHELSHNILKHRDRLDAQGVSRGLFRAFGKNPGRIRRAEYEADTLALYLMARAGYDIDVAPDFWDRFGWETDKGILSDGTHPGRRARVDRARADIAVIRAQHERGEPMMPIEQSMSSKDYAR
jgi:hypothetical protein